ncbi:MAG: response regulator [Candidatus Omnitrophica bacterium]|nr:response regulator [Candidatus Omnitrophota bacterium]
MSDHMRVYKILIIDDDKTLHATLKPVLGANGFDIVSAYSGEEGLEQVLAEKPDLILLDVIMPGIKGRDVCRRLKADPVTADIPVLFLTAKNSDDDIRAEIDAGAAGHITKPVNSMPLVRQIKKTLGV